MAPPLRIPYIVLGSFLNDCPNRAHIRIVKFLFWQAFPAILVGCSCSYFGSGQQLFQLWGGVRATNISIAAEKTVSFIPFSPVIDSSPSMKRNHHLDVGKTMPNQGSRCPLWL